MAGFLVPPADARADVNRITYEELSLGITSAPSRLRQDVMTALVASGAVCIILGCTEISMLVGGFALAEPIKALFSRLDRTNENDQILPPH